MPWSVISGWADPGKASRPRDPTRSQQPRVSGQPSRPREAGSLGCAQDIPAPPGDDLGTTPTQQRSALGTDPEPPGASGTTARLASHLARLSSRGLARWRLVASAFAASGSRLCRSITHLRHTRPSHVWERWQCQPWPSGEPRTWSLNRWATSPRHQGSISALVRPQARCHAQNAA